MNSCTINYPIYNYSDIFYKYFFLNDTDSLRTPPEYVLVFVFSGELLVRYGNEDVTVSKGEYIFLRKDSHTELERKSVEGKIFRSVFMGLSFSFLREFYRTMNKKNVPEACANFDKNVVKLNKNPYLDSIYISLYPYLKDNYIPVQPVLEIRMMEAVLGLLLLDERFYPCLFDCCKPWKKDIMSFLNKNIKDNTIEHIKEFSGEFIEQAATSDKLWIISKKLETAYMKVQQGENTTDIYIEVAYKDVARFVKEFKKQYGFSLAFDNKTLN